MDYESALRSVYEKTRINLQRVGTDYLNYSENGVFLRSEQYNWTCGFFAGMLGILYRRYGDEEFMRLADATEDKLDSKLNAMVSLTHDVGFMWLLTSGVHYLRDGSEKSRLRLMKAATVLASRFNPRGGYIKAWNRYQGLAIVDCMMNIPLLYEMTELLQEPSYGNIAQAHADMVKKYLVRADGSVCHVAQFDPKTGEFIQTLKGAGYDENSAWSRGCAWVIYGFAMSYFYTHKAEYLEISERCANYFLANLNGDGICAYDFKAPDADRITDNSAAAIAASGMLTLAEFSLNAKKYRDGAKNILESLTKNYTDFSAEIEPIITGATVERVAKGVMTGIIYADYYYTEALLKLSDAEFFLPWRNRD